MTSRIKNIIIWVCALAYFPVILTFASKAKSEQLCSQIDVTIVDSISAGFVNTKQIHELIIKKYPRLLGSRIKDVNCERLEDFLSKYEAIKDCEAYVTIGGHLKISIEQRVPLLRVFSNSKSYYIDEQGAKMSLSNQYTAKVLILSGYVSKLKSLNKIIEFAHFIKNNKFWNAQIEQIYVEQNGEFSLSPRVGNQNICMGSLTNYSEKMRNLYALYTSCLSPREWNNYKSINLKYKGQITCTKR